MPRFMIAPFNSGLEKNVRPWLIQEEAFSDLENAYLYYGRVRKRYGGLPLNTAVAARYAQFHTRLAINIGTTDGFGDFGPFVVPGDIFAIGQAFYIDDEAHNDSDIFQVIANGNPAPMLSNSAAVGTYSTTNGTVTITGALRLSEVYFYSATPVMGFASIITTAIIRETTVAFDRQFAYVFSPTGTGYWERLGTAVWTGTDHDFFWGVTINNLGLTENILYVTNFVVADVIKFFTPSTGLWANFTPIFDNAGNFVYTCRAILEFKGRMVLFNTVERVGGAPMPFPQRIRWSWVGTAHDANAWIQGGAGFLDIPTAEQIITVEAIKDRLFVFCEESTWELVYLGNNTQPFDIQRINSELGIKSTFSIVPFDKAAMGIGVVGIHACNGINVERIDNKIPQQIFDFENDNNGPQRVWGIRDYFNELVLWTYPSADRDTVFPDKLLIYNYSTNNWAVWDDSITALGNIQIDITLGFQWEALNIQWNQIDAQWDEDIFAGLFKFVVAGNQEGYTFLMHPDVTSNSVSLQITNINFANPLLPILQVINHNLIVGDFVRVQFATGANIPDLADMIFEVETVVDANNIVITRLENPGMPTYTGGGTLSLVSRININTKQYNFFDKEGRNFYINKVDFNIDKTGGGQVFIEYYTSTSNFGLQQEANDSGAAISNGILEMTPYALVPLEQQQLQLWHSMYIQADGNFIQLNISLTDAQMLDRTIALSNFTLNAMMFYAEPSSDYFI